MESSQNAARQQAEIDRLQAQVRHLEQEQQQLRHALHLSERRFESVAEQVPMVFYQWRENFDGSFCFEYVSPQLLSLFGIPLADAGRMGEFIHPDDQERWRALGGRKPTRQASPGTLRGGW